MASKYRTEYLKDIKIMTDIILVYHPRFKDRNVREIKMVMEDTAAGAYNTELLVEETISYQANLPRSDKNGEDYIDGSDCKVTSVMLHNRKNNSVRWALYNVRAKQGVIRAVIYNQFQNNVAFFLIPMDQKIYMQYYASSRGRLQGAYNRISDIYEHINQFRVANFTSLCAPIDEKVYTLFIDSPSQLPI